MKDKNKSKGFTGKKSKVHNCPGYEVNPNESLPKKSYPVYGWIVHRQGQERLKMIGSVRATDIAEANSLAEQRWGSGLSGFDYIKPDTDKQIPQPKITEPINIDAENRKPVHRAASDK